MARDAGLPTRVRRAFGALVPAQRRVILAAGLLLASMFLPWYSRNFATATNGRLQTADDPTSAISTFTFVEAAIFLVAVGVVLLMFARGEGRAFHLPGGDGFIVTAAGAWATFLVFYRFVDQPHGGTTKQIAYDYGLHWGIFFGLLAALFLMGCGNALRTAHLSEPPLPGDTAPTSPPPAVREHPDPMPPPHREVRPRDPRPRPARDQAPTVVTPRTGGDPGEQLSFDADADATAPTRHAPAIGEDPPAFDGEPPEFPPRR